MMRVPLKELLSEVYGIQALAAFNVFNAEQVHGVMRGARACGLPVIMAITPAARSYMHPEMLNGIIVSAAKVYPEVRFSVHLDHGNTSHCLEGIASGYYDSVMIDASHFSFEKNIMTTREVAAAARRQGVAVEAELGVLSGVEDHLSVEDDDAHYTDPWQAREFVEQTGCDSLAIAIGNRHGAYKFSAGEGLRLDILRQIHDLLPGYPLVLHGASAVPDDEVKRINLAGGQIQTVARGTDFDSLRKAIALGVSKINIATDLRLIWTRVHREFFRENPEKIDLTIPGKSYMDALSAFSEKKIQGLCVS